MGEKFNTVEEVTSWRSFKLDEEIYDLSHLNAHWVEYLDERNEQKLVSYKFIVTYGLHCFTKALESQTNEALDHLQYHAPRESRHFNFERYYLSKQLPEIVKALGTGATPTFHAGYGNYAVVKVTDSNGDKINYFVVFSVFREKKKFRLHICSAYPKEDIGKKRKVGFFVIAKNLLEGKKLPKP
jgi:hypothetical protein